MQIKFFQPLSEEPCLPFQSPSLIRKIRNFLSKIFCDFWRSVQSLRGRAHPDLSQLPEYQKVVERYKAQQNSVLTGDFDGDSDWGEMDAYLPPSLVSPNVLAVVHSFNETKTLGDAAILAYSDVLESEHPIEIVREFLLPGQERDLEFEIPQSESTRVAIPLILKGSVRDHIVCVGIDLEKKKMEFFDSKGLTVLDRKKAKVKGFPQDMYLPFLLERICQSYFSKNERMTVVENTRKAQFDCHNCGVYVCDYMNRFAKKEIDVFHRPLPYSDANGSARREFLSSVLLYELNRSIESFSSTSCV